jgi:hypothetical protein
MLDAPVCIEQRGRCLPDQLIDPAPARIPVIPESLQGTGQLLPGSVNQCLFHLLSLLPLPCLLPGIGGYQLLPDLFTQFQQVLVCPAAGFAPRLPDDLSGLRLRLFPHPGAVFLAAAVNDLEQVL